jgi:transcriptional regulator with XRE-family HTH domain
MTTRTAKHERAAELPERPITGDQLVAYNMAVYRKAAGMSQEDLAHLLTDLTGKSWSKASVSAAERSFDVPRTKLFPADQLIALSSALGVPVNALLLPPMDDGVSVRYVVPRGAKNQRSFSMLDVLQRLFPSTDAKGKAIELYRGRVTEAFESDVATAADLDIESPHIAAEFRASLKAFQEQRTAFFSVARDLERQFEHAQSWLQRVEKGREESNEQDTSPPGR